VTGQLSEGRGVCHLSVSEPHSAVRLLLSFLLAVNATCAFALEFGSPVSCDFGKQCFVQQFADMDPTSSWSDPFCGPATYDGHTGIDIRVLSMLDVVSGLNVLALADGRVSRIRDGEADRLVRSSTDRRAIEGRECGNGVVLDHKEGYQTQYCHLKEGSLVVRLGQFVSKGEILGQIGASGNAEFPHVHVTVRHGGKIVDPITDKPLESGCMAEGDMSKSLFPQTVLEKFGKGETQILAAGIASGHVSVNELVDNGPPPTVTSRAEQFVAWIWLINLRRADSLTLRLIGATGAVLAEHAIPHLERSKATYTAYAGRRHSLESGSYIVEAEIRRGEERVLINREIVIVD